MHALYGGVVAQGMLTFRTAQLGVSPEALRILEEAYRLYRERLDQGMDPDGVENGRPARLHLLHADTGTRVSVELASEALLEETGDVRLMVERVEEDAQGEAEVTGRMPVRVNARLVRSVWTDGNEALEAVSIDGACEWTMSILEYAGSTIVVECRMTDGSSESCECVVNENGDVTLQLGSIPVQVEIRLKEAA